MKIVLLPGLDGTGVLFRPLLAALPPQLEPVVVSYPARESLGYDELLPLVRQALPKDEPFVLLGESFGGPLSLRIVAERPQGLRALILCGSFISCPFDFVPGWAEYCVSSLPFRAFPLIARLKALFGGFATPEEYALSIEALSQVAPRVFAHRLRNVIRVNVTEELRDCTVPILYLQGTRDLFVPAGNLKRIVAVNAAVKSIRIDTSHMILKTRPVVSARAIAEFIDVSCPK